MAPRAEPYQRTRRDEWLFTGADTRTITRGLSLLVRRGVIAKEATGGGRGNLTLYRGVIASPKTGAEGGETPKASNASEAAILNDCDARGRAPVSDHLSHKESLPAAPETGAQTGAETGAAPCARVSGKGKVELSTPRFARSGPSGEAVGPDAGEKLRDFAWRIAKAFPSKRGGVPQASAALKAFIENGHATRDEIEAGVRAWTPYFEACFRENGHHTGTTMAGWLEAEHFRSDPRDVHGWIPADEISELFS